MKIVAVVSVFIFVKCIAGGPKLAPNKEHLSFEPNSWNEIDDYYEKYSTQHDTDAVPAENVPKMMAEHIHSDGSNMVKNMLKNYQSYQTVLSDQDEELEKQEKFKNSHFIDHFHNSAGVMKDYGVQKAVLKDLAGTLSSHDDLDALVAALDQNDETVTVANYPADQIAQTEDYVPVTPATPYQATGSNSNTEVEVDEVYHSSEDSIATEDSASDEYVQTSDGSENAPATNNDSEATEDITIYPETAEDSNQNGSEPDDNTTDESSGTTDESTGTTDESADTTEDDKEYNPGRDGRIVNKDGARRKVGSSGPTRITSGGSGFSSFSDGELFRPRPAFTSTSYSDPIRTTSYVEDTPVFRPRPVYTPPQTVHVYQDSETDGETIVVEDGPEVHVHVHMDSHSSEEKEEITNSDSDTSENQSLLDVFFNFIG